MRQKREPKIRRKCIAFKFAYLIWNKTFGFILFSNLAAMSGPGFVEVKSGRAAKKEKQRRKSDREKELKVKKGD